MKNHPYRERLGKGCWELRERKKRLKIYRMTTGSTQKQTLKSSCLPHGHVLFLGCVIPHTPLEERMPLGSLLRKFWSQVLANSKGRGWWPRVCSERQQSPNSIFSIFGSQGSSRILISGPPTVGRASLFHLKESTYFLGKYE